MSLVSKICLFLAFLLAIVVFVFSVTTNIWVVIFGYMLYAAGFLVIVALLWDYKRCLEFLTMRTTKNGMNMLTTIVVALVCAVCVNYLGNLHNISWDMTQERLNSLSDESRKLLKDLKGDLEIKVFMRENADRDQKMNLKSTLAFYTDYSGKLKVRYINPYVEEALAMEYLNKEPDRDSQTLFVFVEYAGKKIRARPPFDEGSITSAIIKATRTGSSKIYFTRGHGEKDIEGDNPEGIQDLAKSLTEAAYLVESVNLLDQKKVPEDAAALAIVGPRVPFLDAELKWLHDYAANGGKLVIAFDPNQRSNLAAFAKSLGVEFENNYIFTLSPLTGGGPALIAARAFDPGSEITQNFAAAGNFAVFYIASEIKPAPDKPPAIQVRELVKSDQDSFTVADISQKIIRKPATKNVTVAAEASGKIEDKAPKDFTAVIFGDSDFMSNRTVMIGVNRDLAMNTFAKLTEQKDLLSLRPKMPKGSMLILTGMERAFVVLLGLALPVVLFITSGVLWFRRRGA